MILVLDAVQIFGPCLLGTLLETKSEGFLKKLSVISWEGLPQSEKQSYRILHLASLKKRSITFCIAALNFVSFVKVTKVQKLKKFILMQNFFRSAKRFTHILWFWTAWINFKAITDWYTTLSKNNLIKIAHFNRVSSNQSRELIVDVTAMPVNASCLDFSKIA